MFKTISAYSRSPLLINLESTHDTTWSLNPSDISKFIHDHSIKQGKIRKKFNVKLQVTKCIEFGQNNANKHLHTCHINSLKPFEAASQLLPSRAMTHRSHEMAFAVGWSWVLHSARRQKPSLNEQLSVALDSRGTAKADARYVGNYHWLKWGYYGIFGLFRPIRL